MEIGKPVRTITVEPAIPVVPERKPVPDPLPDRPEPTPVPERPTPVPVP